jgi:thioesterase domain-containing protein
MTLQPEGERRPLFLIHPLAGLVFPYYDLTLQLGPDQPVFGLQSIGIAGEASPLTRVESMAEHYLAAIRRVQPQGPYQLAGWSFGGTVALEMAQQLKKAGEAVALLAIIDTRLYSSRFATVWHGSRVFLTSLLPNLWPYVSDYLHLEPGKGTKRPNSKLSEVKRLLQVFRTNLLADSRYRPQRYPGRVTLFRTASGPPDSTWGWGDIAANGVELHQVPGHHMNVLRPPQAQILAEKLSACLDNAVSSGRLTA